MRGTSISLQWRFLGGLLVIMVLMGLFFGFALRLHMKEMLLSEARAKAALMMDATEAMEIYMRQSLRPAVSKVIAPDDFIIEAMSTSYFLRSLLSIVSVKDKDFTVRRVAVNARNPDYEANPSEVALLDAFSADSTLERIEQPVFVGGAEHLRISRPVFFKPDCMRCHTDPALAPAVLIQKYGGKRGFGRSPDELAGLVSLTVPVGSTSGAVASSIGMFALWFTVGMFLLLLIVQIFFNRLVVLNLRRVGGIIRRSFQKEPGEELLAPLQREIDIEGMVRSFEAAACRLSEAREQLKDYARNLESIVESVSEPLMLVGEKGLPVLANSSALMLAASFAPECKTRNAPAASCGIGLEAASGGSSGNAEADGAAAGPVDSGCGGKVEDASKAAGGGVDGNGADGGRSGKERDDALLAALPEALGLAPLSMLSAKEPRQMALKSAGGRSFVLRTYPLAGNLLSEARAVVHIREDTEEKRMLAHMGQSERLAAVGRLAAGLAHEINNPLGVIRCYSELLGAADKDEQSKADIAVILRHVDKAQAVLRDLMDCARPHKPAPGWCESGVLLASIMEVVRPRARSAGVELRLESDAKLPPLYLDSGMLEQILLNLLLNSLDALQDAPPPGGGRICLRSRRRADDIVISVLDNGPGIAEEHLAHIFDPFYTTKPPGTGTGLGLTVAFGLARELGGRLESVTHFTVGEGWSIGFCLTLHCGEPPATGQNG